MEHDKGPVRRTGRREAVRGSLNVDLTKWAFRVARL